MPMKNRVLKIFFIILFFMAFPFFIENADAQPPPPPPEPIPLDGGLTLLIVAGAVYGAKKLYNQQKEEEKKY